MKKNKTLCLVICLLLFLQCTVIPVWATESGGETEPTSPSQSGSPIPEVDYGNATSAYGCRTINGMTPLGGTDQILETSRAAFLYEINTETIIYAYNPDLEMSPGGLAKIMTALIAVEEGDLDEKIVVSTRWNNTLPYRAQVADLKEGEEVTLNDLLHCMMVAAANDAALIIAHHISGDHAAFVEKMNKRAKEIGCTGTTFTSCHGLRDDGQRTTARDMAKIVLTASRNPKFKKIFGETSYKMPPNNKMEEGRVLEPVNHLMYELILPQFNDERVTGGIPSYTSEASGASLVCTAEDKDKGMSLVIVVLGGTRTIAPNGYTVKYYGNFEEVLDLLEYGFEKFKINQVLYPNMALSQFPILGGECSVVGQANYSAEVVLPADAHLKDLIFRYNLEKDKAPIKAGEKIGTVQVWSRTSCVTEAEMYAMHSVKSTSNSGLSIRGGSNKGSLIVRILLLILSIFLGIVVLAVLYLVINNARRSAARAKRRRRRASRRRSR